MSLRIQKATQAGQCACAALRNEFGVRRLSDIQPLVSARVGTLLAHKNGGRWAIVSDSGSHKLLQIIALQIQEVI